MNFLLTNCKHTISFEANSGKVEIQHLILENVLGFNIEASSKTEKLLYYFQ